MTVNDMIKFIKNGENHKYIYHFTDEENIKSIQQHGICSKKKMIDENWWPNKTGGNTLSHELDERRGITPYVSLCFTHNHPMKYVAVEKRRLLSPRYLRIDPDVLAVPGVRVAFGIANANDTKISDLTDVLADIDLEVIYNRTDWSDENIQKRLRTAERLEILVPNAVPAHYIKGIF